MNTKNCSFVLLVLIIIEQIFFGCSMNETVTHRSQLADPKRGGRIVIMTKRRTIYKCNEYTLRDSSIQVAGFFIAGAGKEEPFNGEILFSDIEYVQLQGYNIWHGLSIAGAIVVFGSLALESFGTDEIFSIQPVIGYHPPPMFKRDPSCPFVYSWNGKEYVFDGEAIGTAWGRAFETSTNTMLPSLKEHQGTLNVCITNERPETHYLNAVSLTTVESDVNSSIYMDAQANFWQVGCINPPISSYDQSGENINSEIQTRDATYWTSPNTQWYDTVEIQFKKPMRENEGLLIIHAMNTRFFDAVLGMTSSFIGDQTLEFVNAIENDPETIFLLNEWLKESSINAFLWNGGEWKHIGTIMPQSAVAPFASGIHFIATKAVLDTVRIRLVCLADFWKLDEIGVDWNVTGPLKTKTLSFHSAKRENGKNVSTALVQNDKKYTVLFPSEMIDLTFQSHQPAAGKKITYALTVTGYFHEWMPEERNGAQFEFVKDISGDAKISLLKSLLKQKSVFLPMLYAKWREMKKMHAVVAK